MAQSLRLAANLDALEPIREFVEEAAVLAGLDRKRSYRLMLAVDEIATNVITHGYQEAGLEGDVVIHSHLDDQALTITLEDDAIPFDPYSLASPDDLDAPIEERGIGGLGVFLTIRGVDEFLYRRVEERNHNVFVMQRGGAPNGH
jgi:anti-sigma regulatory factor (Ser/Thr protein kinase)